MKNIKINEPESNKTRDSLSDMADTIGNLEKYKDELFILIEELEKSNIVSDNDANSLFCTARDLSSAIDTIKKELGLDR